MHFYVLFLYFLLLEITFWRYLLWSRSLSAIMYAFLRGFLAVKKTCFFVVKHVFFSKVAILYVSGEGEVTNHCIFTCRYDMSSRAPKSQKMFNSCYSVREWWRWGENLCIFTSRNELQGAKMTENVQKWLFCSRVVKVRWRITAFLHLEITFFCIFSCHGVPMGQKLASGGVLGASKMTKPDVWLRSGAGDSENLS